MMFLIYLLIAAFSIAYGGYILCRWDDLHTDLRYGEVGYPEYIRVLRAMLIRGAVTVVVGLVCLYKVLL